MMLNYTMLRHADNDLAAVESFLVRFEFIEDHLHIQYKLTGELSELYIPTVQAPCAVDGLWQHTCFEAFIAVTCNSDNRHALILIVGHEKHVRDLRDQSQRLFLC